jgi:phosphonate transport system substrate-binding protein
MTGGGGVFYSMTNHHSPLQQLLPLILLILSACNFPGVRPPFATDNSSTSPIPTPTVGSDAPLGSQENPIVLALIPSSTKEISDSARDVIAQLSSLTGRVIVPYVPASYAELVETMGAGQVHVAWLPPLPYLLAHEKGYADAALAMTFNDRDLSAAQFLVNKHLVDNGTFTVYFDPETSLNLAKADAALAQFEDKKPCWTDAYSPYGYVLPLGILAENGIETKKGAFLQGDAMVIKSIYRDTKGDICQFGVALVDSRSAVALDYADVTDRVVVVWITEPIIPSDGIAYASNLPGDIRISISAAFLAMIGNKAGKSALQDTYQIDGLKLIDDTFYDALRRVLEQSGLELSELVR